MRMRSLIRALCPCLDETAFFTIYGYVLASGYEPHYTR
ncbi:hypothetical protein SACS_1149 [Parasaccharibacter apium]|uniref:Uncharacterized protein n=1 Tax=Parasaccharibacter apium TaxID=1510841 RepID=A0A7U7G656_9PROT|nr:hypothetical protein SACS_1149 [Parasaccharibacter apium]